MCILMYPVNKKAVKLFMRIINIYEKTRMELFAGTDHNFRRLGWGGVGWWWLTERYVRGGGEGN